MEKILHKKRKNTPYRVIGGIVLKKCVGCSKHLPLERFYPNRHPKSGGAYGVSHLCKVHTIEASLIKQNSNKFYRLASDCKQRAKRGGFPCMRTKDLARYLEDLFNAQIGKCFYTDLEMAWDLNPSNSRLHMEVEKLEPRLGYTAGNIVFSIKSVNSLKGYLGLDAFLAYIKASSHPFRNKILKCKKRAMANETLVSLAINFK
ncbi:hypothetical protein [Paenibacillus cremeus]|uniref:Uncharacterized protein n=1 Tax=Paenibacillus cremeus TaxID=2163881 RepID=A0A559KAD8_9BACL|nr:hypothetical protein [Paenibacillus cremeus]TVY09100.1 hypothetical protein FPZ49_15430 [Paenibacillus cremeus]